MKALNNNALNAALLSMILIFSPTLSAESISMQISEQGDQTIQKPANGQKMENVEVEFGSPIQKVDSVGEPPITKWVYQGFTVYFEYQTVLHTVVHKS